jgi:hypothetical protein
MLNLSVLRMSGLRLSGLRMSALRLSGLRLSGLGRSLLALQRLEDVPDPEVWCVRDKTSPLVHRRLVQADHGLPRVLMDQNKGYIIHLYQCCGSGMFITDHGSRILIFTHSGSRIPDPKTATKERGEKKFVLISFYVATYFTKLKLF